MGKIALTASPPPVAPGTYEMMVGQNLRIQDATNPDSITITTAPNRFMAIPQADGGILLHTETLDFDEHNDTTPMTFSYERDNGGVLTTIDVTVNFRPNLSKWNLYPKDRSYLPPIDPGTKKVLINLWEGAWIMHCTKTGGMTGADIINNEIAQGNTGFDDSQLTRSWLVSNTITGSDKYYGEEEATALDPNALFTGGANVGQRIVDAYLTQLQNNGEFITLLLKAGEDFSDIPGGLISGKDLGSKGYSKLYPNVVTTYGGTAAAKVHTASVGVKNWVYQNLECVGGKFDIQPSQNICVSGLMMRDHEFTSPGGSNFLSESICLYNSYLLDSRYVSNYDYDIRLEHSYEIGDRLDSHPNWAVITNPATWVPNTYAVAVGAATTVEIQVKVGNSGSYDAQADDYITTASDRVRVYISDGTKSEAYTICYVSASPATVAPTIGQQWSSTGQTPRVSGGFNNNVMDLLALEIFCSGAGYAYGEGYRADRSWLAGHAMGDRSHGFYTDSQTYGVIFSFHLIMNVAHNGTQLRGGALATDCVYTGFNGGISPTGNGGRIFSYLDNIVQTEPGFKMHDEEGSNTYNRRYASGFTNSANEVAIAYMISFNSRPELTPAWTDETDLIQIYPRRHPDVSIAATANHRPFVSQGTIDNTGEAISWTGISRYWGWNETNFNPATQGIEGFDKPTLDALGIGDWAETAMGLAPGADRHDVDAAIRAEAWGAVSIKDRIRSFLEYVRSPFGEQLGPVRTTGARCLYQVGRWVVEGTHVPNLPRIARNWSTHDLPGTAPNDIADLQGMPNLPFNYTPDHQWAELYYSAGGGIRQFGGLLAPALLTVDAAGNTHEVRNGAHFQLPNQAISNVLDIPVYEAKVFTEGAVSGEINLDVFGKGEAIAYNGGSMTFNAGSTVTVGGKSRIGLDGDVGTDAALVFNGNLIFGKTVSLTVENTVEYRDRVAFNTHKTSGVITGYSPSTLRNLGHPEIGDTVEGGTSGATGVVTDITKNANGRIDLELDMVTGTFDEGESVLGPTWCGYDYMGNSRTELGKTLPQPDILTNNGGLSNHPPLTLQPYGTVRLGTISNYELSLIREYQTGVYGQVAPNVNSKVTLGATAVVNVPDTEGVNAGTKVLIDVDDLTNSGANLGGTSVVGNTLVLEVQ